MPRFLIILVVVCMASVATAQTRAVDSLLRLVHTASTPALRLTAVLALCEEHQSLNRDSLDKYAYEAKDLAGKQGNRLQKDLAAIAMANDYQRWGWTDSALATIAPVLQQNKVHVAAERPVYFKATRLQAMVYCGKMHFKEGTDILYKLVSEAETYRDTPVISANMNTIGSVALLRGTPREAVQWFTRALGFLTAEQRFDPIRAAIFVNMADGCFATGRKDSAIYYSVEGVELFKKTQNLVNLGLALQRQSQLYLKAGQTDKAEASLKEMISYRSMTHDADVYVDDNVALIDFYITTQQIDKAIEYCKKNLLQGNLYTLAGDKGSSLTNNLHLRLMYYEQLARCYQLKGDNKGYSTMLATIISAKDSLYSLQSEQAIAEVQTKYEVQKKENTIIQQHLTIAQKNNTLLLGVGIVFIIALIAFFVFRDYRKKQRLKVARAIENEKVLATKAVADAEENERKRIAADLHDNLGAYAASIASNLDVLDVHALNEQSRSALSELNHNSQTMVAQLSDTIWALNKDSLTLTAISDRVKVVLNRLRKSHGGIQMDVVEDIADASEDIELPPTQAFHLFQIIQEAITNAVKHSGSNQIKVVIQGGVHWKISVIDHGTGMHTNGAAVQGIKAGGNGLLNMKARAEAAGWTIQWRASSASGTTVDIEPVVV